MLFRSASKARPSFPTDRAFFVRHPGPVSRMRKSARLRGKFFGGWIHAAVYGPEPVAHFSRFQNFFACHTVFAVFNFARQAKCFRIFALNRSCDRTGIFLMLFPGVLFISIHQACPHQFLSARQNLFPLLRKSARYCPGLHSGRENHRHQSRW